MINLKQISVGGLLFMLICMLNVSCSNGPDNKTASATDSTKKMAWIDPQKGKIWGKVNIVEIPLTAYENHILGKVRSVSYRNYKLSENPDSSKVLVDSGYNVYDKFGHLVNQNEYKADGTQKWNCVYIYDDKNRPTGWDFKFLDRKAQDRTAIKCDKNGNVIELVTYSLTGKETEREIRKYDNKGNETDIINYNTDNAKVKATQTYKYDEKGNQIEWTMRDTAGKLTRRMACVYDNNHNKVETDVYTSDTGKPLIEKIKNDSLGRAVEDISYKPDGSILSRTTMKYDNWENIIEYDSYDKDGKLDEQWTRYSENEYDTTGNITKETDYKMKDGKRVADSYTETKYTYY